VLFVHQKENPWKTPAKIKRIREEMHTTLENKMKATSYSPKSAFEKKNKVEEGGASSSRAKSEQESTDVKAQKMMRGKVKPSIVLKMVRVVLIVV